MEKQEITDILSDNEQNDRLFKTADKIRHENVGDEIHLRGLIEFSNICKCQCKYCGLRSPNKNIQNTGSGFASEGNKKSTILLRLLEPCCIFVNSPTWSSMYGSVHGMNMRKRNGKLF